MIELITIFVKVFTKSVSYQKRLIEPAVFDTPWIRIGWALKRAPIQVGSYFSGATKFWFYRYGSFINR